MDTLQCAIVLAKLERLDWEVEQRIAIGQEYNTLLVSVFAQYTVLTDRSEGLQKRLAEAGIPTAVHYPVPLNEQPAYKHLCCSDCTPVAQQIAKQVMSLPMGPDLQEEQQRLIVKELQA